MRLPLLSLSLGLFFLVTNACSSRDPASDGATSTAAATEATPSGFVGCRPSAGECRSSCPDGRFLFLVPDDRCPADSFEERGACVCGDREEEPPPATPEGTFVGCRPSAGECVNSCPTHAATYVADWPACPEAGDPPDMHGGCFCR